MKKRDFILTLMANNLNVFINRPAIKGNIADMMETAELMFEAIEEQLKEKESIAPKKLAARQ